MFLDRLYAPGMASGNYMPSGNPDEADIISVHEWGPLEMSRDSSEPGEPGVVNIRLAEIALELYDKEPRPIVGSVAIDVALRQVSGGSMGIKRDHLVAGESTDALGRGVGTWGELKATKRVMDDGRRYKRPILLAQAYHIGRVAAQAHKLGIADYVIPEDLPDWFRPESKQCWIRGRGWWVFRSLVGNPLLLPLGRL